MIIRPHQRIIEEVSDLRQIVEKRRYMFIYTYSGPHKAFGHNVLLSNQDFYNDIYLVNDSTVHGTGFLIPKGITLHARNTYRGYAQFASIPDYNGKEKPNYDSVIRFYFGNYSNHIKRPKEPLISLSSPTVIAGGGPGYANMEEEFQSILNSHDIINGMQPFPQFYNVEDMAVLESKNIKVPMGDFTYDFNDVPTYRLGDLIDPYTKIIFVNCPNTNQLLDESSFDAIGEPTRNVLFNNGYNIDLGGFKSDATELCMLFNEYIMDSIFSEANLVVDTESGLFNITDLKLKFLTLSKEEQGHEFARLVQNVGESVDNLFGESDFPSEAYSLGYCPNRLTIHIGSDVCTMRYSNVETTIRSVISNKEDILSATGKSSTSDIESATCLYASEGLSNNCWY